MSESLSDGLQSRSVNRVPHSAEISAPKVNRGRDPRYLVVHARSESDYTRAECGSPRARLFRGDITCKYCLARRGLYYPLDQDYFA